MTTVPIIGPSSRPPKRSEMEPWHLKLAKVCPGEESTSQRCYIAAAASWFVINYIRMSPLRHFAPSNSSSSEEQHLVLKTHAQSLPPYDTYRTLQSLALRMVRSAIFADWFACILVKYPMLSGVPTPLDSTIHFRGGCSIRDRMYIL